MARAPHAVTRRARRPRSQRQRTDGRTGWGAPLLAHPRLGRNAQRLERGGAVGALDDVRGCRRAGARRAARRARGPPRLLFAWTPLLALGPAPRTTAFALLVLPGLGARLLGNALAQPTRRAPPPVRCCVFAALGLGLACTLIVGAGAEARWSVPAALAVAVRFPWTALTGSAGTALALLSLFVAVAAAYTAHAREIACYGADRGRSNGTPARDRGMQKALAWQAKTPRRALIGREVHRLTRMSPHDLVGVLFLAAMSTALLAVVGSQPALAERALSRSGAPLLALFALLLPCAMLLELLWGRDSIGFWIYVRATTSGPAAALRARLLVLVGAIAAWTAAFLAAVFALLHAPAATLVTLGILCLASGASAVAAGSVGAVLSGVSHSGGPLPSLLRHWGLAVGLFLPVAVARLSGSTGAAIVAGAAVVMATTAAAEARLRGSSFTPDAPSHNPVP